LGKDDRVGGAAALRTGLLHGTGSLSINKIVCYYDLIDALYHESGST
jgi:hypothetical protein